ncbi:MAG: hypothetical protein JRJ45_07845 [Deltaproteobacteria bacterium]|nr:hypothetical protein [Deltaproteobacteria bacterium]
MQTSDTGFMSDSETSMVIDVDHDDSEKPFRFELGETEIGWFSVNDLNSLVRFIHKMKRVQSTRKIP